MQRRLERLNHIPWLFDVGSPALQYVAGISQDRHYDQGDQLFAEGDVSKELFILTNGIVDVRIFVPGHGNVTIYSAEPFDLIGWASMTPTVRLNTGSAWAITPADLIAIDGRLLQKYCDDHPPAGYLIMRRLVAVISSRLLTTRLKLYDIIQRKP